MGRGRPAEEIDPAAFLAGVLIGEEGHRAAAVQHLLDLVVTAVFRDQVLARRRAEAGQVAIEIGVVEIPRDGESGKTEDPQGVAAEFEVAEMARDDDHRAVADQLPHERGHVAEL